MKQPRFDGERWRIQAQRDGKRYSFSSSIPGAKGRRECREKYERWLYDEGAAPGTKTVSRVAAEFLDDVAARRGPDSECFIQYERYIRLYIAPQCGNKKICKMTLRDWQGVINGASGERGALSVKTLTSLRSIINMIIKFGYADYQCELPRGELYIPQGRSRKEKEILQPDELRRLFAPSELHYHPLFCFLAITGMRPSEALGLQVSDVVGEQVVIHRGVNCRGKITPGKNANARRMVPVGRLALRIIQDTIARNERLNLRTPWIFCDKHGAPGCQSTMRNQWLKLKEERNLHGTVYSLRHTFISIMKSVMPEQTIKDIVGHSVSMDTFGVYGHIVDGDSRRAAEIIDLTFGADFGADLSSEGGRGSS